MLRIKQLNERRANSLWLLSHSRCPLFPMCRVTLASQLIGVHSNYWSMSRASGLSSNRFASEHLPKTKPKNWPKPKCFFTLVESKKCCESIFFWFWFKKVLVWSKFFGFGRKKFLVLVEKKVFGFCRKVFGFSRKKVFGVGQKKIGFGNFFFGFGRKCFGFGLKTVRTKVLGNHS